MTAFDTAWDSIVKIDEGMWEEIYAPLLAQTTGMGDLDSAPFASDFVPTRIAMDNIRARVDEKQVDEFMDELHQNRGDHGFDVDRLAQSILEEGFNPFLPPTMVQGKMRTQGWNRSGRPDPTFEFGKDRMQQFEGNHRLLALAKLGAPYVPYMGLKNHYVDRQYNTPFSNPHPYAFGEEYMHMAENRMPYSLGAYIDRGHIPVPPSYLYGRELVPGMGRLLPVNAKTGEPMDMLSHLDEGVRIDENDWSAGTENRQWKKNPSWRRVFDS